MTAQLLRDSALILLRLFALIGLAIAGYLLYLALTGNTAAGCGEGAGGCNEVLSSRWSKVYDLPVSAFAAAAYLLILTLSLHAAPRYPQRHRDGAWRLIAIVSLSAGLSALWFIALQLFVLHHVCYYCMAAHGCSLTLAGLALMRSRTMLSLLGVVPIAALVALQLLVKPAPPTFDPDTVLFGNFDTHAVPTLGDPDAPHVIALLYDYNCPFCRDAHRMAGDAVKRYDGQLVVVLFPTAIDPACNRGADRPGPHSQTSCQLARLALAVWLAKPQSFADFDKRLIEHAETYANPNASPDRYLSVARAIAQTFVAADELDRALADPRIDEILQNNGDIYKHATYQGRRGVPRLIITGRPLPGFADQAPFYDLLERAYPELSPGPSDADANDQ